jgi:hypothetical protein
LAVHAPGEADLNLYAYVHGRVYVAVDPLGLDAAGLKTAVANHDASGANTAMTDTSMADALNVLDHAKSGDVDWLYGATNDGPENRLSYAARTAATRLMPVVNDGNSTHGWGLEAGDQSAAGAYLAGKYIAAAGDKVTGLSRSRTGAALVALNNIGMNDPSHIAYAMATLRREASWGTSLEETPACRAGKAYEKSGYWGRGMIQVTHLAGYQSMSELLGTDLMGTNRDKLIHDVRLAADAFAVWWYNPACLAKKNIADWGLEGAFGKSARGTDARALVNAKDFDSMPEINAAAAAVRASMKPDATYWTRTQRGRL